MTIYGGNDDEVIFMEERFGEKSGWNGEVCGNDDEVIFMEERFGEKSGWNGGGDDIKRKANDCRRKKVKRASLPPAQAAKFLDNHRKAQKRYRQRLKANNNNQVLPNSTYSKHTLGKAVNKVLRALPNDPSQQKQVLQHAGQTLGLLPTPKAKRTQSNIPARVIKQIESFYKQDSISWQAPGKRDCVTVKENGVKVKRQKRHLLYNIREVYELLIAGTVANCVKELKNKTPPFLWHVFIKRKQSEYFEHIKENASDRTVVCQVDYAENFIMDDQNQIQSAHWTKKQLSIFTAYAWMGESGGVGYSFGLVSSYTKHAKFTVVTCLEILINEITGLMPDVDEIIFFSDGAASQFKNRYLLRYLTHLRDKTDLDISWNYFASSHSKGVVDGIGGTIKRLVWTEIMAGKRCSSADEFVNICREKTKTIIVGLVRQGQFDITKITLEKFFDETINVNGIGIFACEGCQQKFCRKHSNEHREELAKRLETIVFEHDLIQQQLQNTSNSTTKHPIFTQIDKWETESVNKIKQASSDARNQLQQLLSEHTHETMKAFRRITDHLRSRRITEDYAEPDLDQWTKELNKIKDAINRPKNIDISEDSSASVKLIRVMSHQTHAKYHPTTEERFGEVVGGIEVRESGQLAVSKSDDDASVYGTSLYSIDVHQISIVVKIGKLGDWIFLGIISSSDSRQKRALSLPSAYGWCGASVYLNGTFNKGYGGFDGDIIDNDRLELTVN
ncbi:unnamed protein product, partial [Didymodactylos carnosus]